jgi:Cellulose binding domain
MKKARIAQLAVIVGLLFVVASGLIVARTSVFAASTIQLLMFNSNTATTSNMLYPQIEVKNTGSAAIALSSVTIHYYYTEDGTQAQNFWCDWSSAGTANITGTFFSKSPAVANADHYLQIGFTSAAGSLAAGATVVVQSRIAKTDWSNYNQANDYSFNATATSYVPWTNITGYIAGTLNWGTEPGGSSATATPTTAPTQGITPTPAPTQGVTPTPAPTQGVTPTPTRGVTPTPTPTQGVTPTPTPTGSEPNIDRYYPSGTPVSTMISGASSLTQQQVKVLIEQQVKEYWSVIQSTFGFSTLEKAYAFFLGQATRESTLQGGLETGGSSLGNGTSGSGASGHSYGPLQAAETAYANTNTSYQPETDVPQIYQYDLVPANFYDIGISIHMGIRHMIHFAHQASAAGETGVNIARYALAGYNTGWVTNVGSGELTSYSDEIGALAGWYLNNGHLYDTAWTWTGDSRVDRSNPWGWYP